MALLLVLIGAELAASLHLNGGRLIYTLDDPYIHLALAQNLLGGVYGINASEVSAPASSILWPFVLAPFSRAGAFEAVPLVINVLAAVLTLDLYRRLVGLVVVPAGDRKRCGFAVALTCLLIPATNLVGLVFTGMEHSLQVLLAAALVFGLVVEARTGRACWWLLAAVVAGPLVRYENLALSVPAIGYLVLRGHVRPALAVSGLLVALLGGFSLFLRFHDLGWLPSSVAVKSGVVGSGGALGAILSNLVSNLQDRQSVAISLVLVLLLAVFVLPGRRTEERLLAGALAGAVVVHMAFGRFGWYSRYEVYAWAAALLGALYLFREHIRAIVDRFPPLRTIGLSLLLVAVLVPQYLSVLTSIPFATSNIHQQQHQMHRFVTESYKQPVAVNDLGWVAFDNETYVLDLWGLASKEALRRRKAGEGAEWMSEVAADAGVRLAMIYDDWFEAVPEDWRPLGRLHLGGPKVSAARSAVTFYALDAETEPRARALLAGFVTTLPAGVRFDFAPE